MGAPLSQIEPSLLTENDVARITGIPRNTLAKMRSNRAGGPPFLKIGASVRYRADDLNAWIDSHPRIVCDNKEGA